MGCLVVKFKLGVYRKPTDPPNMTRSDPTRPVGLGRFLRLGGLGWVTKNFFYSGSSWVWVIKLQTRQTQPTHI